LIEYAPLSRTSVLFGGAGADFLEPLGGIAGVGDWGGADGAIRDSRFATDACSREHCRAPAKVGDTM